MARRTPIPSHLHRRAFRATADGGAGLSPKRLRGSDIDRPFHGVRSIGIDLETLLGRCRAYVPRLREGEVFSHTTAARIYRLPLPRRFEGESMLHIASGDATRPRRPNVQGHRIRRMHSAWFEGLPVSSPAETWRMLEGMLDLPDLVAVGDALVSGERLARGVRRAPLCSIEELRAAIERHRPARGTNRLLEALAFVRTGVDSRRETHTRLLIVAAGFAEPTIAPTVIVAGGKALHPDLGYPARRVAIEYEGEEHRRDVRRWRDDIARRRALEAAGWVVMRVTIDDLRDPRAFLADLAAVLRARAEEA